MTNSYNAQSADSRLTIVLFLIFIFLVSDHFYGQNYFLSARDNVIASWARLGVDSSAKLKIERRSEKTQTAQEEKPVPTILTPFFFQPIPINRANKDMLMTVVGIGPGLADRIVDYRQQYGPFSKISDLQNLRGIGPDRAGKFATAFTFSTNK